MYFKIKLTESNNERLSTRTFMLCLVIYLLSVNFYTNAQIHEKGTASGQIQQYVSINRILNTIEVVEGTDIKMISDDAQDITYAPLWSPIFSEDFEGSFPGPWDLTGSPTWEDETYKPLNGSRSVYCAGSSIPPPGPYANNMNAWLKAGPFDLSNTSDAELLYNFWSISEVSYDYFWCVVSINDVDYYGTGRTGTFDEWNFVNFDLTDVYTLGNLCGQPQVWIAFIFRSDNTMTYEGTYLDDIILQTEPVPTPNDPPEVEDIPDQTINEGESFATINLDGFVSDSETADANIDWTYSGNTDLVIDITDRIATINVADENWYGSEAVTFTATDDHVADPLSASDAVLFTMNNVNDPPVISGQQTLSIPEDQTLTILLSSLNVSDVDNSQSDLSVEIQAGDHYSVISANSLLPEENYNDTLSVNLIVNDLESSSEVYAADVAITPVNDVPVMDFIPDQEIEEGSLFTDINLDDCVEDVETPDELITWAYAENSHLQVSIVDRVATIILPQEDWTGGDTIVFIATDDDTISQLSASDTVIFTVTPGTGIAFYKSLNMKAYPNPTEGLITIELSEVLNGEILLQVFTVKGELVMNSKQKILDKHLELNIQDRPSGNYLIRLISPDFTETFQITKL